MNGVELMRAFRLRDELLTIYRPQEAELWLITPQMLLDGKQPCRLLGTTEGHRRVRAHLAQLKDCIHI